MNHVACYYYVFALLLSIFLPIAFYYCLRNAVLFHKVLSFQERRTFLPANLTLAYSARLYLVASWIVFTFLKEVEQAVLTERFVI